MLPPNSVVFLGGVGDDKYAAILHDAVKAAGLRVEYRVDKKEPTGRCGVVITGHDRSMVTDLGAANHYDLEHLKSPEVWKLVEGAEFYFVGGYHLTVCPPAIMALAEEAAAKNKTFVFSLSAPFIPQFFKDPLDATAPYWDYVIGNETEALAYAESHGLETKDVKEIAKALADLPKKNEARKRIAIITQGTLPTIVAEAGKEIMEVGVHAIEKNLICDTTGAGDAFAAGFTAGLVAGESLERCVDQGQWLAKLSIQELGPSYVYLNLSYHPILFSQAQAFVRLDEVHQSAYHLVKTPRRKISFKFHNVFHLPVKFHSYFPSVIKPQQPLTQPTLPDSPSPSRLTCLQKALKLACPH